MLYSQKNPHYGCQELRKTRIATTECMKPSRQLATAITQMAMPLIMQNLSLNIIQTSELYKINPHIAVMNEEISCRGQNCFLHQLVNVFFPKVP